MSQWIRLLVFSAIAGLTYAACAPAIKDLKTSLPASEAGTIWFAAAPSLVRSPDRSRFVTGEPVVLSGDLRFPSGAGPFPTVVLAHRCGGLGNAETGWAPVLREMGYATFVMDSFRGRGLTEVCTSAGTLTGTQRIPDAYGALRILATHPKIDARRVALMGFSHGGILSLGASTTWARDPTSSRALPSQRVSPSTTGRHSGKSCGQARATISGPIPAGSPSVTRSAWLSTCVAVWLAMMGRRRASSMVSCSVSPFCNAPLCAPHHTVVLLQAPQPQHCANAVGRRQTRKLGPAHTPPDRRYATQTRRAAARQ